ncbi:MAG: histidine--tRNA ligase [Paludibacter sp.]|nr:histidine--tRNA ligase [Bacteroidales bacterium]MCM1069538.1 histidine--tRNA ligase [Prevotella sp.]MCM1354184.1 histidine--tRNA ligase [Bacteroides sp.]MCM1443077.1 histidine--tRNA ligase [Muribaculum sp.]MCM1482258.1 histidine--tRNA ligase [Paludibacter sp.]
MKPSIPKGTRDFTPQEMERRNYIFDTVRDVFRLYGFQQIETPALENLSTLMGKYGEEGDKLLFKILNSGNWLSGLQGEELSDNTVARLTNRISEKGLRYDLTVPFARFVVQNRDKIQFPFKRYQIQPVWRADRPQKGRYREFYQCDVDVVGTDSLVSELELIQIVREVYRRLGIRVCLKINNRKILAGIAEMVGQADKIIDITVAIDKLDKIGLDNVNKELLEKGLPAEAIGKLQPILSLSGSNTEKLSVLKDVLAESATGLQGIAETETILNLYTSISEGETLTDTFSIELDLTLARGLNYYTGAIFEVKALDVAIGSITGGGRYDNLTGIFGMPGVSGVGISFGADRIYDVLNQLNLYPATIAGQTQLLFASFGEEEQRYALRWATQLRAQGFCVEVFPEPVKMKRQMNYADQKHIPFVAIVGSDEMQSDTVMLKNMFTGEQQQVTLSQLAEHLQ